MQPAKKSRELRSSLDRTDWSAECGNHKVTKSTKKGAFERLPRQHLPVFGDFVFTCISRWTDAICGSFLDRPCRVGLTRCCCPSPHSNNPDIRAARRITIIQPKGCYKLLRWSAKTGSKAAQTAAWKAVGRGEVAARSYFSRGCSANYRYTGNSNLWWRDGPALGYFFLAGFFSSTGSWSILAARMKSFSLRPPMAWVESSTETSR